MGATSGQLTLSIWHVVPLGSGTPVFVAHCTAPPTITEPSARGPELMPPSLGEPAPPQPSAANRTRRSRSEWLVIIRNCGARWGTATGSCPGVDFFGRAGQFSGRLASERLASMRLLF